jgi:protein involved in polysaccharide export with SLBB domain
MAAAIALLCLITVGAKADELTSPAAYKLGPGDQILITVFGEEDLSMDFQLNDTGTLNYPFLGELQVAGLSVTELEQLITRGRKGRYLVNPDVTVSIKEYRPFYIRGEVEEPGGLPYQPGLTLEKAIALSGGFTERASKKKTTVIRAGDTDPIARPIKLNDLVHAGDVITVPQSFF